MDMFMDMITSDIGLGVLATIIITSAIVLTKKHNGFKQLFSMFHKTAEVVEESIPDDTKNKKLSIIDRFLKIFIKKYKDEIAKVEQDKQETESK